MQAVASVVMNRVRNPRWWGRSIVEVCLKPWQFSVWNIDDANRRPMLAVTDRNREFKVALDIATEAIAGTLADVTNSADHYHHHAVRPLWARTRRPVASIGAHRFYRIEIRHQSNSSG